MPRLKFGKYEVLARLATGGTAHVFLARKSGFAGFSQLVCIKTLIPERASDRNFVQMFLDEARIAARLSHANCVQIYDFGCVAGSYFLAMEHLDGKTVWNVLQAASRQQIPISAPDVAAIVSNVCAGLEHAHHLKDADGRDLGLVHRDVCPNNVMITFDGQVKLLDFGIALADTRRTPTATGVIKGKFSYMSPEQLTGQSIDRRSDIYSLGVMMFECLTCTSMHGRHTPEMIAERLLTMRTPRVSELVPDVPPALDDICARALSKKPSARFDTAGEMAEALRDYLRTLPHERGPVGVQVLLGRYFGHAHDHRRRTLEDARSGEYDEKRLLGVLGARAVRGVDLYAEPDAPELSPPPFEAPKTAPPRSSTDLELEALVDVLLEEVEAGRARPPPSAPPPLPPTTGSGPWEHVPLTFSQIDLADPTNDPSWPEDEDEDATRELDDPVLARAEPNVSASSGNVPTAPSEAGVSPFEAPAYRVGGAAADLDETLAESDEGVAAAAAAALRAEEASFTPESATLIPELDFLELSAASETLRPEAPLSELMEDGREAQTEKGPAPLKSRPPPLPNSTPLPELDPDSTELVPRKTFPSQG